MTVRLFRLTVIGIVVRSQMSIRSDIVIAEDKESRKRCKGTEGKR